jgi:hypothetical protein
MVAIRILDCNFNKYQFKIVATIAAINGYGFTALARKFIAVLRGLVPGRI